MISFCLFLLEFGKTLKAGSSYGTVAATKGGGKKVGVPGCLVSATSWCSPPSSWAPLAPGKPGGEQGDTWCLGVATLLRGSFRSQPSSCLGCLQVPWNNLDNQPCYPTSQRFPWGQCQVCDCASQALAELQLSATYSAKPLVLYRFTVLQLLVASCLTVINFPVRIRSQLSCF